MNLSNQQESAFYRAVPNGPGLRWAGLLVLVLSVLGSQFALAQQRMNGVCSETNPSGPSMNATHINLAISWNTPPQLAALMVQSISNGWNDTQCNTNGNDFPTFNYVGRLTSGQAAPWQGEDGSVSARPESRKLQRTRTKTGMEIRMDTLAP